MILYTKTLYNKFIVALINMFTISRIALMLLISIFSYLMKKNYILIASVFGLDPASIYTWIALSFVIFIVCNAMWALHTTFTDVAHINSTSPNMYFNWYKSNGLSMQQAVESNPALNPIEFTTPNYVGESFSVINNIYHINDPYSVRDIGYQENYDVKRSFQPYAKNLAKAIAHCNKLKHPYIRRNSMRRIYKCFQYKDYIFISKLLTATHPKRKPNHLNSKKTRVKLKRLP